MFTDQELQLLNSITEDFSRRSKHASLQSFKEFMGKLYRFIDRVKDGYDMTIYDYTNDLSLRDLADELLWKLPPTLKRKVAQLIDTWDKQFDEATNVMQDPLLGKDQPWWWYRIPKKLIGDLKEDIESSDIK